MRSRALTSGEMVAAIQAENPDVVVEAEAVAIAADQAEAMLETGTDGEGRTRP
jgi:hypothetical protein